MAKRVSPEEKPWNPVEDQLAKDVLQPVAMPTTRNPETHAPPSPRVASIDGHREQASNEPKFQVQLAPREDEEADAEDSKKLSREKRVLLTLSEEETLDALVSAMGKRLKTSVTLSNLLRATISLIMHSQDELLSQSEKVKGLKRPANKDSVGLATFEHNIARIVDRAIRGSRVMD